MSSDWKKHGRSARCASSELY